jgi:signal transduction histidine kinase
MRKSKVMAENTVHESIWTLIKSFQEANQVVTESLVAAQERNRSLAEHFFKDGMEVLKANQAAAQKLTAAQERNRKLAERFFKDGMEVLKANQEAAESLIDAQERNVQYVQRFFNDGREILEGQAESMQTLMQEMGKQVKKQQEALQTLANQSVESYSDFLRTPLSYYQQTLDAAETLTRQGLENFQKAAQQMQSDVKKMNEQKNK